MCVPVCMYLGAPSSCLSSCVDTVDMATPVAWSGSAAHPHPGTHEGGTGGAIVVAANAESVPCCHLLPHKASALALL